ncbi:hypothetical protein YDYSG_55050 [Paenibacillus tyrfis]|uniref:hypothetical protein n=1 Tax=Paenibacillus tyrfis TaxID=1501230 RepID=UPI002492D3F4|nr:hypothetical protein [Paenibacillus tyrfis]GLI09473.1 hypothetical protein YDYSG_55050 [Paenibacillus tyrfis]
MNERSSISSRQKYSNSLKSPEAKRNIRWELRAPCPPNQTVEFGKSSIIDAFIRTMKANIQTILSKHEDSEPLHEVGQNIAQLKMDLKALVSPKHKNQIDDAVYDEEHAQNLSIGRASAEQNHIRKDDEQKKHVKERINEIIKALTARKNYWNNLTIAYSMR